MNIAWKQHGSLTSTPGIAIWWWNRSHGSIIPWPNPHDIPFWIIINYFGWPNKSACLVVVKICYRMKSPKYLPTAASWRHFSKQFPRSWQHGDGCGSHAISELRTHKKSVEGVAISGMISPSCMVQWLSVAIQSYLFQPKMREFLLPFFSALDIW